MSRDFAKVRRDLWHDESFLRLDVKARLVALYLLTCATWDKAFGAEEISMGTGLQLANVSASLEQMVSSRLIVLGPLRLAGLEKYGSLSTPERVGRLCGRAWQKLREIVFQRDGYKCVYCGRNHGLECDHVIPFSRGGGNEIENLATACRACNRAKWARTPDEWRGFSHG